MTSGSSTESLRRQIAQCEAQLVDLRQQLAEAQHLDDQQKAEEHLSHENANQLLHDMSYGIHDDFRSEVYAALSHVKEEEQRTTNRWPLDRSEYKRYGRQLIMPEIGLQGTCLASCATTSHKSVNTHDWQANSV